jgi:N-acetylglucosamine transport system permease protein
MRQGKYPFVIACLILPITLYALFVVWPMLQTFYISMTAWRGFVAPKWIGFENYQRLFDDDYFWKALQHHGMLLLALPLVTIAIALFFAFLLNVGGGSKGGVRTGVWGSKFYRVIFFLPQVLAVAIIGVLFQTVYRPNETGLINGLLMKIGIEPVGFLVNPNLALWSIMGVAVWQAVGFYVVLFTAGMSSIPSDIYEAAELDGANRFTLFFRVTLPLLWDSIQVAWVYLGIIAFDFFALVNVLSIGNNGGPDGHTTMLATELMEAAKQNKYGYASAYGVVIFFLTITFAALTLRVTRRETIEY